MKIEVEFSEKAENSLHIDGFVYGVVNVEDGLKFYTAEEQQAKRSSKS